MNLSVFELNFQDGSGSNSAFFACRHAHPHSMLKILSEYSCSLTLPNAQGQIPLHYLFSNKAACRDKVRVMKEMKKNTNLILRTFSNPYKSGNFGSYRISIRTGSERFSQRQFWLDATRLA